MNVGGPELVIVALVAAVLLLPVLALGSVILRGSAPFDAVGQSRATWIVLLLVGVVFTPLGLVLGAYYFLSVRPKLDGGSSLAAS